MDLPSKIKAFAIQSDGTHPRYLDFVLDAVTRGASATMSAPVRERILTQGEYTDSLLGVRVTFRLPKLKDAGSQSARGA
jgi:hypothetical protein